MKVETVVRRFKHGALQLEDPDPAQTAEQVKEFYARIYPELTNAEIEGPEHKGNVTQFEFRRAVGTKGMGNIDFGGIVYFGIAVGIVIAVVVGLIGWWLFSHVRVEWIS